MRAQVYDGTDRRGCIKEIEGELGMHDAFEEDGAAVLVFYIGEVPKRRGDDIPHLRLVMSQAEVKRLMWVLDSLDLEEVVP